MADAAHDARVLAGGRGVWNATPWNYSSLRVLWLAEDGSGDLVYGYGQTIYAFIKCRWEIREPERLRLMYLESPAYQRFRGFTPVNESRFLELDYKLTSGVTSGTDDVVGHPYMFRWTLEFSAPPWPPVLELPYEVPRVFFGHREKDDTAENKSGAAPDLG